MTPAEIQYEVALPPTQNELPYDDGVPMESQRHKMQVDLLIDALTPWLAAREDGYVGGDMFVYYSLGQVKNQDFRGLDFFVALDVPKRERKSWVSWEEGKTPDLVIELLSDSTREVDKTEKKRIYQNQMHVPEYFWYDPFNSDDLQGFRLQGGVYQSIQFNEAGQLISEVLELALVRWQGYYKDVEAVWLRWVTLDGAILLTGEEFERDRADRAEAQILQIARSLLATGMSIEQIAQTTGLSIEQIHTLNT